MKKTLLFASVAACVFAFNANAVESNIKPYVGLDYVYTNASLDFDDDEYFENKLNSLNLNLGAKLHKNFGIEAFYQKSADSEGDTVINKLNGSIGDTETSFDAYGIDVIGYLPVAEKTEVFGALGLGMYDAELKALGLKGSDDGLGIRLGVGAQYNINDHFAVRGLVRYVDTDIDGLDNLTEFSAGVRYSF